MQWRGRLLAAGLATLCIALVIFFPARTAYHWFVPDEVRLAGIKGTIWNGGAAQASVQGVYLRELGWRVRPLALFSGRLAYAVTASPAAGFLDAQVGLGLTGTVTISDLQGSLALAEFAQALGVPGLRGELSARFETLVIKDGLPVTAEGALQVADLLVPLIDRGSLGGYRAVFSTQDVAVTANVEDTDGVVNLSGNLQIFPDRNYQFLGRVAAKPQASAGIRQQLRFLGTPDARGQHELRLEGRL